MHGWEPTTAYEYDDAGRMIASRPEPEWDDEQRGWMLALAEVEAGECPRCHGDMSETTDEALSKRWQPVTTTCYRCVTINAHSDNHREDKTAPGQLHGARLRD